MIYPPPATDGHKERPPCWAGKTYVPLSQLISTNRAWSIRPAGSSSARIRPARSAKCAPVVLWPAPSMRLLRLGPHQPGPDGAGRDSERARRLPALQAIEDDRLDHGPQLRRQGVRGAPQVTVSTWSMTSSSADGVVALPIIGQGTGRRAGARSAAGCRSPEPDRRRPDTPSGPSGRTALKIVKSPAGVSLVG